MLQLNIDGKEFYDEKTEMFIQTKPIILKLEHSLLSISKWESKWHKPFLAKNKDDKRTTDEIYDYIKCMTLNKNISDDIYKALSHDDLLKVMNYIEDPMTATTIHNRKRTYNNEVITSELIYYWMITYSIPFTCEKWHINRLITLIRVCGAKNNPQKMSRKDIYAQNRALNKARRKALKSRG